MGGSELFWRIRVILEDQDMARDLRITQQDLVFTLVKWSFYFYGDFLFFYFYIFHPWKSFTNKLSRRLYWVALCCICEILFSYDFVNKSFMRVMTVIFLVFPYILPCARGTNSRMRRISPKVQERNRWRKRVEIDALKVNASICSSVLTRVMWQE